MRTWHALIILTLATLAAMYPIPFNHFVHWDDQDTLFENPALNPPTWHSLQFYWQNPALGLYIPLTDTYWAALATIAHTNSPGLYGEHLNPHLFHTASLLLHLIDVILVFVILRELQFNRIACLCGALIFAVHPVQVETVAWASGAKDLLYVLFSLLCIWQYLLFAAHRKPIGIHYTITFLCLLAAMLCKPTAMVVPFILIVLDRIFLHRSWQKIIVAVLPMIVALVPLMVEARNAQDAHRVPLLGLTDRLFIAGDALTFYFQKLLIPLRLCVDYGRSPIAAMQSAAFKIEWLLPLTVAIVLFIFRNRAPKLLAAALLFLLPLLPVLGFIRFMFQAHSTVADHYLYLPMLGIAMSIAILITHTKRAIPIIFALAVIFIVLSNLQSRTWANSVALFSQAIKINPDNSSEQGNLAEAFRQRGDFADAIPHLRRAIQIDPRNRLPHLILAQVDLEEGKNQEAIDEAQTAISVAAPDENLGKEYLIEHLAQERVAQQRLTTQPTTP